MQFETIPQVYLIFWGSKQYYDYVNLFVQQMKNPLHVVILTTKMVAKARAELSADVTPCLHIAT